jgi:hypothetical protein
VIVVLAAAGCGGGSTPVAPPTPPSPELARALAPRLATLDPLDGSADHVIAACVGCGLAMEGSPEHPLVVGEYTLHFCSAECRDQAAKDLEATLEMVEVPPAEEAPPAAEFGAD